MFFASYDDDSRDDSRDDSKNEANALRLLGVPIVQYGMEDGVGNA